MEGLIFGRAYLRKEICVSKSKGLALYLEVNLPFYFVFEGNFPSTSPRGDLYLEGRFNGGFFALQVWGAYFRNFTVCDLQKDNLFARWSSWSSWSGITIGTSSTRFTVITSHTITTRLTLLSFVTYYSDELSLFTFWSL